MYISTISTSLTATIFLLSTSQISAAPTPNNPLHTAQTLHGRQPIALPPIAEPQRLTFSFTPSSPSYPPTPQNGTNTTLLISTLVTPSGTYPFKNSTYLPNSDDPATPVPFTWMNVQVRTMQGGGADGIVVNWTRVPVDVEGWGVKFDLESVVRSIGERSEGEGDNRVGISAVGVSPDGIQSFWDAGEVVVRGE